MTVYRLLWQLLKHALHGRGRDEVYVDVGWNLPDRYGSASGVATEFRWESNADAFCMIEATSSDGPWSDSRETAEEWSS